MNKLIKLSGIILILLTLIISLVYFQEVYSSTSISNFKQNPETYSGDYKSVMGKYQGKTEGGFILLFNGKEVMVKTDSNHIKPKWGEVLVYGELQEDGTIKAIGIHNYDYNYLIYFFSFIAGIVVLIWFFKDWRLTRRGFENA